jgi:DNA invertase Pin-like site-specific DNA recombinase
MEVPCCYIFKSSPCYSVNEFRIYLDVESGTTDKRQQMQQLIAYAKAKKFDV